jgi:hypothetical protein
MKNNKIKKDKVGLAKFGLRNITLRMARVAGKKASLALKNC